MVMMIMANNGSNSKFPMLFSVAMVAAVVAAIIGVDNNVNVVVNGFKETSSSLKQPPAAAPTTIKKKIPFFVDIINNDAADNHYQIEEEQDAKNKKKKNIIVKYKDPPGPMKFPIIGTLPDFFARGGVDGMCDVHESLYEEYGIVYGMNLGTELDDFCISDPRLYDILLRKEGKYPIGAASQVTTFTDYYKENNLTLAQKSASNGPEWKEWRTKTNPDMFVLWDTYIPALADCCSKISAVAEREVTHTKNIEFVDFISRSAFDMFSTVMYGSSPQTTDSKVASPQDIEFVLAAQRAFDITGNLITNPMEKFFKSDLYQKFVINMDDTYQFGTDRTKEFAQIAFRNKLQQEKEDAAEKETEKMKQEEEDDGAIGGGSGCPVSAVKEASKTLLNRNKKIDTEYLNPSFVERLVHRDQLSIDEISELAAPLLMAGVDTTAYQMSWFYLNLALNPDKQDVLAKELYGILKGKDVTTKDELDSLLYLKACIRESHRLTPSGAMSVKTLSTDVDIPVTIATNMDDDTTNTNNHNSVEEEVEVEYRYKVKAGQRINLNLRGYPMDERYVESPTKFIPERFLPDAIDARKGTMSEIALDHPAFQDMFGRGKRRCLGGNVAVAEMIILAARLIQDYKIEFVDDGNNHQSSWKPKQKLMLRADPYPSMKLIPRTFD